MQIFIYGPPGVGKSTVGRKLAESLALPFTDLDEDISQRAGKSIPEIFSLEGETGFRSRETQALEQALSQGMGVVALGGGALLNASNRTAVEAAGPVICLYAEASTLKRRLETQPGARPLLAGESNTRLEQLLAARVRHYASFPFQVTTGPLDADQVAWQVQVELGVFHVTGMGIGYDVRVQPGGLTGLGQMLYERGLKGPIALVSDSNVGPLYGERVLAYLQQAGYMAERIDLPAGEAHKTLATVSTLWERLLTCGVERNSTLLALGGGVVSDLAGFAAATYLRGIPWVVTPTTLLAMADASLGGKTGFDLPQGKNLVGAFYAPRLVLADPLSLQTLPEPELRSGLAEVVKGGLLGDVALFELCAQGWQAVQTAWDEIVRRTMAVKVRVIQDDPYEQGKRAVLNLGHTIGHGLEQASGFRLRHGEAVAIGLVLEARLAEYLGVAQVGLSEEIAGVLRGLGLPTQAPVDLEPEAILAAMRRDKKRLAGKLRFALPVRVGEARTGVVVESGLVSDVLMENEKADR